MNTYVVSTIIKNFVISMYSTIILLKLCSYKRNGLLDIIKITIICSITAATYILFRNYTDMIMSMTITFLLQVLLLNIVTKLKLFNLIISDTIATSIVYVLYAICGIMEFLLQNIFKIENEIINLLITLTIEFIMLLRLTKIRRIKNGLTFINIKNNYVEIAIINIGMFVVVMCSLMGRRYTEVTNNITLYLIILGICLIYTIQKLLQMYYKQKLTDDTILDYKQQLEEKENEIKRLTEESYKASKVNHEFYHRQKALEQMVKERVNSFNNEAGEENEILKRIEELSKEHTEKIENLKTQNILPQTEISEIDDMFKYMKKECTQNKIKFDLKINGNIYPLINNIIAKNKLETLIGDHMRDAIIAVNSSTNSNKQILAILGLKDNVYELCIFDTGIEFKIETLLKLGIEPATTHKETGGSGIGFMTTFETLKECNASLEIEEKQPENENDFTKAVKIVFDNKNEYRIKSYRADEINKMTKDNRIIVST